MVQHWIEILVRIRQCHEVRLPGVAEMVAQDHFPGAILVQSRSDSTFGRLHWQVVPAFENVAFHDHVEAIGDSTSVPAFDRIICTVTINKNEVLHVGNVKLNFRLTVDFQSRL